MLLAWCLILSFTVLQAQLLLYQTPRFKFVAIGATAQILCISSENYEDEGTSLVWYKARENEKPLLIKSCSKETKADKFICKAKGQKLTLEILHVQIKDSGIYLCAKKSNFGLLTFSNGSSSLIVGDSYTPSTRVSLLLPPTHLLHAGRVACVVHGVSNLVQVSWDFSGELQQDGLTLMVKNSSASFTFASVLRLPRDWQRGGKNFTCEVRFNSSGPTVKKSAVLPAPSSMDSSVRKCLKYAVPTAVVGGLALLALILSLLWIRLYPSRLEFQSRVSEAPSSDISQEDICYAQLAFHSRTSDGNHRKGALQGKRRKM